jgi:CheY-like chemotaxis protein
MPAKILLVDDDVRSLQNLGHFLRSQGYDVNESCDGSEAATILENDLVISDVIMPGVSGLQLLDRIRSIACPPNSDAFHDGIREYLSEPDDRTRGDRFDCQTV